MRESLGYSSALATLGNFGIWRMANASDYMPERGARDALAQLVLTWISMIGRQRKIAVYCSDVSGAVDKVNSRRLLQNYAHAVCRMQSYW